MKRFLDEYLPDIFSTIVHIFVVAFVVLVPIFVVKGMFS